MSPSRSDRLLLWTLRAAAAVAGTVLVFILVHVAREALPVLRGRGAAPFLTDPAWHPRAGLYGLWPMLCGTVLVTAGAVLVATVQLEGRKAMSGEEAARGHRGLLEGRFE